MKALVMMLFLVGCRAGAPQAEVNLNVPPWGSPAGRVMQAYPGAKRYVPPDGDHLGNTDDGKVESWHVGDTAFAGTKANTTLWFERGGFRALSFNYVCSKSCPERSEVRSALERKLGKPDALDECRATWRRDRTEYIHNPPGVLVLDSTWGSRNSLLSIRPLCK